ncbi:MAG: ATP-binding protein [Pseudomonadota bacterium]
MIRPRLLKTTAIRLALRYAALYALVLGLTLGALFWTTSRYIDADVVSLIEQDLAALQKEFQGGGTESLIPAIGQWMKQDLAEEQEHQPVYLLVSAHGERLAGNLLAWPEDVPRSTDGEVENSWIDEEVIPREVYDDDAYWPVITTRLPDGNRLLVSRNVEQAQVLQETTEYLVEILSAAMVLAIIMSITLGRAILARMEVISRTASDIAEGNLSRRIPQSERNDEFDVLAGRLNAMLDRIQQLIAGIREVTDNVAHDLRSPLNRLRSRFEVTLLEPRSDEEYRDALRHSVQDTQSLINTFNALLNIAQAEAGNHRSEWGTISLDRLATDLADLYRPSAEDRQQTLKLHFDEYVEIIGSRNLLAQAVGNLLENAIKYTPADGAIRLTVRYADDAAEIVVADSGPGIPDAEKEHVLERFVRLESSRQTPGNGLGLSLVQAVATLHQAELELADANPGLRVTIRFPTLSQG